MKYRLFGTLVFALCYSFNGITQDNIPFDKETIPNKELLQQCKDSIKWGNKLFDIGDYKKALNAFQFAQKHNGNNADLNLKIGTCYLNSAVKTTARPYLEKAHQLKEKIDPDILYNLGQAYQYEHDWKNAIENYKKYDGLKFENKVAPHIAQCEFAQTLEENKNVTITNLGPPVNSIYGDYVPVITTDGKKLYFTSRRPETTGKSFDNAIYTWKEDIYFSEKQKDGTWSKAKNIGAPINSDEHDATVNVSPDGQKLFIYRFEHGNGGDIYESDLNGTQWSIPTPLSEKVNTKHQEVSVSLSADEKTMYFVTNKPGGEGNKDIYFCKKDDAGNWSDPKNLGKTINTRENEESVFIHADNKTLYFSSEGHNTIGGYDIFKSEFVNGEWSTPVNLGLPINTADNDVFFTLTADGKDGYYASGRIGGIGEKDIYQIEFKEEEKELLMLSGIVEDESGNKLSANVKITDLLTNEIIFDKPANSLTGEFLATMNNGSNYQLEVTHPNHTTYTEEFTLEDKTGFEKQKRIVLMPTAGAQSNLDTLPDLIYTIQVATREKRETANSIKSDLQKNGIKDVYVQTIFFTDTDEELYRVRISQFDTDEDAQKFGNSLNSKLLPDGNFWVDNVRKDDFYVKKKDYEVIEE